MTEVKWSREAAPKDRVMEGFKANIVVPWNAVAESDNDTLLNYWVVDEAKTCGRVYQKFSNGLHCMRRRLPISQHAWLAKVA
mgnify:FL=1